MKKTKTYTIMCLCTVTASLAVTYALYALTLIIM